MRPLKLTMSAFGPYAQTTRVDFDSLGTAGVYLVCGDTGSGKTMIFDAICFALFGETSGDVGGGARSTTSLRSDYADNASDTFVELVFEYRGQRYRIKRNPEYIRAKTRGEGTTKQTTKAEMELADGRVVSGVRKVNDEVEALLGIDSEQFKQIVMLAQGEFRKLLTADTETRETIFRKLFGTEVYERIQERLAEESRKLESDNRKVKTQISAFSNRVIFPAGSHLEAEFQEKKELEGQLGVWLYDALNALLSEDEPEHERLDGEVENLRLKWSDANALIRQVAGRPALEQEKQALEDEINRLKKETPSLVAAFDEQKTHDEERAKAVEQAAQIEGSFPKYEELQVALGVQREAQIGLKDAKARLDDCERAAKEASAHVEELTSATGKLVGADVKHAQARAALDTAVSEAESASKAFESACSLAAEEEKARAAIAVHERADAKRVEAAAVESQAAASLEKAREQHGSFEGAETALVEAKAKFATAERAVQDAEALGMRRGKLEVEVGKSRKPYEDAIENLKQKEAVHDIDVAHLQDLQKRQRAGRAGLLAADLQEGAPCPVCGSVHHPKPAVTTATIPSDAELDAAAEAEERSKREATAASIRALELKTTIEGQVKQLEEFDEEHGGESGIVELTYKAKQDCEAAHAACDAAEARAADAKRARQMLEDAQKSYDVVAKAFKAADESCRIARENAIAAENAVKAMRTALGEVDVETARAAHDASVKRRDAAEETFEKAKRALDEYMRLNDGLTTAKADFNKANVELEAAKSNERSADEASRFADERVVRLKADLEFSNLDDAREAARRLRKKSNDLKAARDAAESAVRDNASTLATREELLKANAKTLESIPQIDVDATRKQMDGYFAEAEAIKATASKLKSRIDANRVCLAGLESALAKAGDIEERYGRVKLLADAATGNLAGKQKIRFEAYVQAIYFDKVIQAANARLKMLTSGQFELVRHSEGTGNAKVGLGLYVVDSFTGRARDASSLSGGESFQASLCLALGLSDIVQAHAGGIEFDTMFVDEGFGSLDQGALGNAISLLSDLSGGSKLVGIISHVEDLKANIPKKIVVTKSRAGSSVAMEL